MKWFGESWGAPVNETNDQVDVPIGRFCAVCPDPIKEDQRGLLLPFSGGPDDPPDLPYHLKCFLKSVGIDTDPRQLCEHPPGKVRRRQVGRRVHRECLLCGAKV